MKIKHHFLGIFAALFLFQAGMNQAIANNVDLKKAQELGAYYMSVQTGQKSLKSEDLSLVYEISNMEQNIPALYFFNTNNGGFVIVSGSDCIDPIIAYSTSETLKMENIPPAMMWLLNEHAKQVVYAQNNNLTASTAVAKEWIKLANRQISANADSKAIYNTVKSKWDQGYPFNDSCPLYNNERCVTGCVATAMSQIIHYWKYPVVGNGSKRYKCNPTAKGWLTVNFSKQHYNYDLMPDTAYFNGSTTCNWTAEQKAEVAKLNYHCGVANEMGYGVSSSGADSRSESYNAFLTYFKYDPTTLRQAYRTNAPYNVEGSGDTAWVELLATEIKAGRPVFYCGADLASSGQDARHAFIATSYNPTNKKFKFNWGWGGLSDDTWCNVITSGLVAAGYRFEDEHYIIYGIQPPADSLLDINHTATTPEALPAYPNPAHSWVNIPYNLNGAGSALMQIYSIDGRLMEQRTLYATDDRAAVNVENYPHGLYIYRIGGVARKFVVQ